MSFRSRYAPLSLAASIAVACLPLQATAQRVSPTAIATPRVSRGAMHASLTASSAPIHVFHARRATDDSTPKSNVAATGALVGALLGGAAGYGLGRECESRNTGPCQRTVTIGGTVIGALVGYGMGSIIDMGIAHDRARASTAGKD